MDLALIASIRNGSVDAFEGIVEKYQYPITRYLYRLTGDLEIAQDLAQDTFLKAYKSILKNNSELKLNAWLFRIATNNALQYLRRKKLISFIPFENLVKTEPESSVTNPENTIEDLAIKEVFSQIPYNQRVCLVLHYVEGFRYREIAETIGISEEAVRKRITRGVQVFRRLYKEENNK